MTYYYGFIHLKMMFRNDEKVFVTSQTFSVVLTTSSGWTLYIEKSFKIWCHISITCNTGNFQWLEHFLIHSICFGRFSNIFQYLSYHFLHFNALSAFKCIISVICMKLACNKDFIKDGIYFPTLICYLYN